MGVDAWTEWAGSPPQAPAGLPSAPAGPGDLYDLVVTRAARLAGTEDALLWLVDDDGPRLVVRHGIGRFAAAAGRSLGKGEGLAGEIWQAGGPLATTGPGSSRTMAASTAWAPRCACPWPPAGRWSGCWGWPGAIRGRVAGQAESELLCGWGELAAVMVDRVRRADAAGPGGRPREQGWLPGDVERYRTLSEQIPAVLYSEVHTPGGA